MPRYLRSNLPGGTFFFTVNSFQRRPILTDDRLRASLRQAINEVREELPFRIVAWVLLPDHLHCIWELPVGDAAFGVRWGRIKRQVTRECAGLIQLPERSASNLRRREGMLWQRRFWEHEIRDDDDFRRHVDYIHWNPVKHGHVSRAIDWPYSTFRRFVNDGAYPEDWGVDEGRESSGVEFGE